MKRATSIPALVLLLAACSHGPSPSTADEVLPAAEEAAVDWAELAAARLPGMEVCEIEGAPEPAVCGAFEVPEDRSQPAGRQLRLEVVVVPAQQSSPPDDPVWLFEGGPGGRVSARTIGSMFAGAVRARDIVHADQRGTAGDHRLDCDLTTDTPSGQAREMYPVEPLRDCVERLSQRADLKQYTSVQHAQDVEFLRQQLGYGKLNLRGGSYGTRAMMVYAQLYPEQVRTMFGIGVDAPLRPNLAERGISAQDALEGLSRLCAENERCGELTPDLQQSVGRLLAEVAREPKTVSIDRALIAQRLWQADRGEVVVTRGWLAEQIRLTSYFAFLTRALPWAVHHAEQGDWEPLTSLALGLEVMFDSTLAAGVALSVQCSEGMDFDVTSAVRRNSETLFGSFRLLQQQQGCAHWPHEKSPPLGRPDPRTMQVPTLFLSGAFDPVTPARYGEEARELFPNSRHVVLEEGQHGPFDFEGAWPCVHQMWADLLERGSVENLDTTCAEALVRPTWVAEESEFWEVVDALFE